MALFGKDKKETTREKKDAVQVEDASAPTAPAPVPGDRVPSANLSAVLRSPHITEKATDLSAQNVYAFMVDTRANKKLVKAAVKHVFGMEPKKVRIIRQAPRVFRSRMRGTAGMHSGSKKAYVYLKEGDRIEFV